MRILGIDPGYAIMGYGIVDYKGSKFTPVAYGSITTEAHTPNEERLMVLYDELSSIEATLSAAKGRASIRGHTAAGIAALLGEALYA